ncbi:ATP-binding cassette domain-containing protein [Ruminococcus albus]|uniref:ABC transporter n=1 Tax=Ruminococcus albus TaxID=1264 RepID=A0A1I1MDE4_RUMAL|nr:ATP-binding cassette domain-containing protein [Ruminococcus albus]SFC81108.1 ABC transporter [Ruminococcus albus]
MKLLEIKNLRKSFDDLEVLKDISMDVNEGQVVSILGPSGSGKSTLLRSALDPELTAEILKVLKKLAEEKMTMVIVTHEIAFARSISDHVVFMDGGVIVEQCKPADVIDKPSNVRTKAFLKKLEQ